MRRQFFDAMGREISVDADYVKVRLEEAGACLMALPARGTLPAQYRVAWPEIVQAVEDIFADTSDRQRPSAPKASAITEMDEAFFQWIPLIGAQAVQTRRLVWLRSLIHPLSGKNVWPWRRLAGRLGLNRETLALRHGRGVDRIVTRLNRPEWMETEESRLP